MNTRPMSEKKWEILRWLHESTWATPMEVGGRDGSHHSATLAQLVKEGLVERKKFHAIYCPVGTVKPRRKPRCCCKGSCRYRRTPAGSQYIKEHPTRPGDDQ